MKKAQTLRAKTQLKAQPLLRGWSQEQMAEKLGTTNVNVSRWEHGTHAPSPYFLQKLCDLFGKSVEDLGLIPVEAVRIAEPPSANTLSPQWNVPYQRNPFFSGREEILDRMHLVLHQQKSMVLTQSYALSGLGGIGKTQTAIEYAYRHFQDYSAIFWIVAETYESVASSLASVAELLNLPEQQEQDQKKMIAAVTRWLSNHRDWLLIVDNVEDLDMLKDILPTTRQGALLFTTRHHTLDTLAQCVVLKHMSVEKGTQFLLHRAGCLQR